MNNKKKTVITRIMCAVLVIIMLASAAIPAFAYPVNEELKSQWVQVDGHYKYKMINGDYAFSSWIKKITDEGTEKWYVDSYGNMVESNWCQVDGKWYTFAADGKVVTRQWVKRADGTWIWSAGDGKLTNGWMTIDGKDYHFNEKGLMDTGWLQENNTYYFLLDSGEKAYGWVEANGLWYYLDPSNGGKMTVGEKTIGGKRYFFDAVTGEMR